MGRDLDNWQFAQTDYVNFEQALQAETERLRGWFDARRFAGGAVTIGYELEACLVDQHYAPADANARFLARLNMPQVVPELARCNIEFNGGARALAGDGLQQMHAELDAWLARGRLVADQMGLQLVAIGVLPTLEERHLNLSHISKSARYRALNAAVAKLRDSQQVDLAINGHQSYRGRFDSIMPESAATSLQLHISLPPEHAVRWYNAALIASGPLLAVAANAPYLFGRDLWAETRIPVFAQSVDTGAQHFVTFGSGYVQSSLFELFAENASRFPVLLPQACETGGIEHLLLHNGTIWRWNRPIVGISAGDHNPPHLRLEHRSLPSGPSVLDMIANCAFFYGLVHALAHLPAPAEQKLPFAATRQNFYRAARQGLDARLNWLDGEYSAPALFEQHLLPLARAGLSALNVVDELADHYLQVVAERVARGLSGAGWQRAWVARHNGDMAAMLAAYLRNQESGAPVSQWPLD